VRAHAVIDTLYHMGSGPFWAQASMTGSLNEPNVNGAFRVENGEIQIPFFDRPLSKGIVNGRLHTKGIDIPQFTFEDGWSEGSERGLAKGSARIDFDRLKIVDYKVDVQAERFRYRGYAGIDATCNGALAIAPKQWSPEKKVPHIIGRFRVDRAALDERVLVPPEQKSLAPPGVVIPVDVDSTEVAQAEERRKLRVAPPILMDLSFFGTKNCWLRTRDIEVEFAGDVTLHVTDTYTGLSGEVRSLRGRYAFYNTTFDIERGTIEFTDPEKVGESYIDGIATTNVLDEEVEIQVSGTLANPKIESTSSSGYSEAEIYRLLALRIKPTDPDAGPPSDQSDFSRDLLASWGALVASRFGRDLSRELGIDTFDVDVRETSSQVGVGKYLGRDFFVRYRQQVGSQNPQSVTEEVHETPERQLLLEYRLSRIFRLQGETGTIEGDGYLNVDLMAEWGY
jgi:autotransporter translocation and assembly factor TamB